MITGTIKNKVDKIWTDIWAGGLTNPLTVIEQLTYLLFIRSLDEKELDNERMDALMGTKGKRIFPSSPIGQSMRWSQFKDKDAQTIFNTIQRFVFPAIKEMKGGRLPDFDAEGNVINEENLNAQQIFFVQQVILHVENNGYMEDPGVLLRAPFDRPVPFFRLFNEGQQKKLMAKINEIRENAVVA